MDILDKNIYETLISSADDETVIQMLNANVNFRPDDSFFERLMSRKYPLLTQYKAGTWKQTYLKMIYYIAKLEEEFGIPYIPVEDFNPEKFYKGSHGNLYDTALYYAVSVGRMDIVKLMIHKGASNFNWAISDASLGGHLDMVKFFIDKGAKNFTYALGSAARGGNLKIVKLLIHKIDNIQNHISQYYLSDAIREAEEKGYTEIADFLKNHLV